MKRYLLPILITLSIPLMSLAQTGNVLGTVRDSNDQALPGVHIIVEGTTLGTISGQDGTFEITGLKGRSQTLVLSMVGFQTVKKQIKFETGQTVKLPTVQLEVSESQLSEVIITGAKETEYVFTKPSESLRISAPLMEVPQNISVVSKQTIKEFGIVGTAEMARMTSGIIKRYGGNNDFAFTIRGTDATNNVFRNGVGGYWWNQQTDAFMLDRVEFVKGPAGFMIGNAEPGGLLNEVTKQADGEKVREVMMGYGSWNLLRAGFDVGGKFSDKSRFSYRVVAGGQYTAANYDYYKSYRTFLMPSVRYSYGNGSHIQAELVRMDGHVKADNNNNITFNETDYIFPLNFNPVDPNALNGIETDDQYLRLSHEQQLGKGWRLKSQLANVDGIYQGDGMYVSAMSENYDTLYREYWVNNWRNKLVAAQSFVDGKFKTGNNIEHSILAGLDYGETSVKSSYGDYNPDGFGTQLPLVVAAPVHDLDHNELAAGVELYPEDDWGTEWMALYVQDHIKFFDKVIVTVAGRLSRTKSWASWDSTTVHNTTFTPRAGLTYLINKNMSAYFLIDETFLPQTGRKVDRSLPEPLTGTNTEIGFKSQLMGARLFVNASLFRTIKNHVLVENPVTTFYEERGQITSQGFETDMTGNISENVVVNVNYTFTDAKVTEDINPDVVGFPNYGVAKHTGNAMIRYKFIYGKLTGFSIGGGMQLIGDRSAVWAGWTDPADKFKTSPAYAVFDANIGYDFKGLSIYANVYNLFNKQYIDSGWWNSAVVDEEYPENNTEGYLGFTPSQPLNFRIAVNYKF